ncbi:hypothetical protein JCM19992_04580 [Thermostilla marina]
MSIQRNRGTRKLIVGCDEAGYGPTLGPLVIAATAWETSSDTTGADLYRLLASAVSDHASANADRGLEATDPGRLIVADSKRVYRPGGTIAGLERAVSGLTACLGLEPNTRNDLFRVLDPAVNGELTSVPWYHDDRPLPACIEPETVAVAAETLRRTCDQAGIRPAGVRAQIVPAIRFNRLLSQYGSKGALLSHTTLAAVIALIEQTASDDIDRIEIACDRHGGRKHYAGITAECFETALVRVIEERRDCSRYSFEWRGRSIEIAFRTGGESLLPAAWASMIAKYVRELAMEAFNCFWRKHVDTAPTAGYPQDAKRFLAAIEPARRRLGIDPAILRRAK